MERSAHTEVPMLTRWQDSTIAGHKLHAPEGDIPYEIVRLAPRLHRLIQHAHDDHNDRCDRPCLNGLDDKALKHMLGLAEMGLLATFE